ncbi:MAG: hypothetical protein IT458_19215 [Planctomycetes bacterium]|nr:hypothetical protein [Planctomycetota bacterium]
MLSSVMVAFHSLVLLSCAEGPESLWQPLRDLDLRTARRLEWSASRDGQPVVWLPDGSRGLRMTAPIRDRVDPEVADSLLVHWKKCTLHLPEGPVPSAEAVRRRQLDPALAFLRAEFPERTVLLEFGGGADRPDSIWARCGDRIGWCSAGILQAMQVSQEALRDPRLFAAGHAEVECVQLSVTGADGDRVVADAERRAGVWAWRVRPPGDLAPAPFAEAVLGARAAGFRHGERVQGKAAAVLLVRGAGFEERAELHPSAGRTWVAAQAHRDVDVAVELPPPLPGLLPAR